MIIINGENVQARIPVYTSPANPTTITVGDVLAAVHAKIIDIESTIEGNDPNGLVGRRSGGGRGSGGGRRSDEGRCLCLTEVTPIEFFRGLYGKAGFIKSDEGPYAWEWRVRGQQ
jgi:hypothetical protein